MSIKASKVLVILGPTSSGKSALAVTLAKKFNGEVISADSRQVYRGLDIGSGKITKKEMRGVRHHLLDVASLRSLFTAASYRRLARRAIRDIQRRGKLPIVAGGTAFYINTLLYDPPPPEVAPDPKLRARLEQKTTAELFAQLKKLDPLRAQNIERSNKRRLVRALEIVLATGRPVPALSGHTSPYRVLKIGITVAPEKLKEKIHVRLLARLRQGMVAEVKRLHANGLSWKHLDDLGLEYRYVSRYLQGLLSKEEMVQQLEKEIWRYARRQMTWWRRDKEIRWVKSELEALALVSRQARA